MSWFNHRAFYFYIPLLPSLAKMVIGLNTWSLATFVKKLLGKLEGEAEIVAEEVEAVASVVEKVATVAEKVLEDAEMLPEDAQLKKVAMLAEHASEQVAHDAQVAQQQ